ncbi:MAG: ATP-binding protein [Acidobacteriota bacterium]
MHHTSSLAFSTHQQYATSAVSSEIRKRILIVDDSPAVRISFKRHLQTKYDCSEAASVSEALDELKTTEFALVIADILMPGLSGIELLRKIVERYPYTAVIIVSGIDQPQRVLDAIRLGAYDYLIKPCDLETVELTVERVISRRDLIYNAQRYKSDLEARNLELAEGKAQLERLQAQIVQNAKMASLGQLAAGVAHEINNPVGFVYGNLDLLNESVSSLVRLLKFYDEVPMPSDVAERATAVKKEIFYEQTVEDVGSIINDCREGAERIRDIVKNLKTFSRLDEAEFKRTDIHEGIDSTLRILSRYFSSDKIKLVRDYGEPAIIDGFSGQLNQVWMNLLVNAAQAVGSEGEVRIKTRIDNEDVTVAISDTGIGMSPDQIEKIFDPFLTTKPVGEGTGLGLSISFGIVKRHSGEIRVESVPGRGTTMIVKLPIHSGAPTVSVEDISKQITPLNEYNYEL